MNTTTMTDTITDTPSFSQSDALSIWYNIDDLVTHNKIKYECLSNLDKSILDNDLQSIKNLLAKGETNYYDTTLCSGFYQKKYRMHPIRCHPFVCHKTSTYYALLINNYYYTRIFDILLDILDVGHTFRFALGKDERESNVIQLSNEIKNVYDLFCSLDCVCNEKTDIFYKHTNFHFKKVNDCFSKSIPSILETMEKIFGSPDQEYKFESYGYQIKCHRDRLGTFYLYQNVNDNGDHDVQKINLSKLRLIWRNYQISCEICKVLFNQQSYEFYKHYLTLKTVQIDYALEQVTNNPYYNINYVVFSPDQNNAFSLTAVHQENPDLMGKLKKLGGHLPESLTIVDIINRSFIRNAKEIIKTCDNSFLTPIESIFATILHFTKMRSNDKIEMIEILVLRGVLDNMTNLLSTILRHELSFGFTEKVSTRSSLIKKASIQDVYIAIQLLKHRELNIIFKENSSLVDGIDKTIPLFMYLREITNDMSDGRSTLKTILDHHPTLSCRDEGGKTPLIFATKMGRQLCVEYLLKYDANPFDIDSMGLNSLHYAILENHYTCIELLKDKHDNKKKLVNELTYDNKHPLILAMACKQPVKVTDMLLSVSEVDYNFKVDTGDNILHYVLDAPLSVSDKSSIFRAYLTKDIDLLESSKAEAKPLVVRAVEKDLFDIVVMIMNKLIQLNEIKMEGTNLFDGNICDLIKENKIRTMTAKDSTRPNFYPLVLIYLKEAINTRNMKFSSNIQKTDFSDVFTCIITVTCLMILMKHYFDNSLE
jgi:ankyrin repeat protein